MSVKRRVAAGAEVGVYLFFKEYCFRVRVRRARVRVNPNPSHNPETAFFKKKIDTRPHVLLTPVITNELHRAPV